MFASLSFKKFQRRIRSPFTFLKKLTKKQRKAHKRQASKQLANHDKPGNDETSTHDTLAVPALNVKIPPESNTHTSTSDSGVFFPPTPKSLSSESGPTSRVHRFDRGLPEIVDEVGHEPSAQVERNTLGLSGEKDVVAEAANQKEELKTDPVDVKDAEPTEKMPVAIDIEVEAKEQAKVAAVDAEPVIVENKPRDNESTKQNPTIEGDDIPLPSKDEVVAKEPEAPPLLRTETEPEPVAQAVERVEVAATVPTHVDDVVAKEQAPTPVDCAADAETLPQPQEPATPEVKKVEDTPIVESPVTEISVQQLHIATTENDKLQMPKHVFIQHSPPQTPHSLASPKGLTPPTTPRKRVNSEIQTKNDKDIMDELQASVRSREKKRKEQERIQAAEKERKQRELRVKLEKEMEKAVDSADGEEVLREVRSWRKQREASLKKAPDDVAKIAAYREAFTREEIMVELQSAVQSRSARPFVEDPAEKRQQLLLEELYARRVPATQA